MKKLIYTIALAFTVASASAQKIGYINTQEILVSLPAYDEAKLELENFAAELQTEFEYHAGKYQEKEKKYLLKEEECKKNPANCDNDLLKLEYKYVMESGEKLQNMQYEMEAKIQEKETILINRVVNKIKSAAEAVAKEKGITYILDYSTLIYAGGEDLNAAVKTKIVEQAALQSGQ